MKFMFLFMLKHNIKLEKESNRIKNQILNIYVDIRLSDKIKILSMI